MTWFQGASRSRLPYFLTRLVCVTLCVVALSAHTNGLHEKPYVQEILRVARAHPGEIVVGGFVVPGECVKCNIAAVNTFDWIRTNISEKHVKFVGIVQCDREVELRQWAAKNPIYEYYMMNPGDVKEQLGLSSATKLVVLDSGGAIIGSVSESQYLGNFKQILADILSRK